jgi:hypothetical protein
LLAEKVSFFCIPKDGRLENAEVRSIPTEGEFEIPFLVIGYHGTGMTVDEGVKNGIDYIEKTTDSLEKKLIDSGSLNVIKLVKTPIDYIEQENVAVVGEELQLIGI